MSIETFGLNETVGNRRNLNVKLYTPSPPGSSDGLKLPWLPKTPSNPTEALSQTEYIEKKDRNSSK